MSAADRPPLSREVIARAALDLTDEGGLAELSMRKLGTQLGVEAMSLYHYVQNKDDLLDAVMDELFAEIELPRHLPEHDWESACRRGFRSFHGVLIRHKAAHELFSTRPAQTERGFEVLLWAHSRLTAVGLDLAQAHYALHFAVSFVLGHVSSELGYLALIRDGKSIDPDDIDDPVAADFVRQRQKISSDEMFEAGLEAVVAGLRSAYQLP